MNDFGSKIRQAEKEVKAKQIFPEKTKVRKGKPGPPKGVSNNPAGMWKPGVSANPGGRPKMKPITDAYRLIGEQPHPDQKKYKGMTYAQVAAKVAFEKAIEQGDTRALQEITDRIEGKVPQDVKVGGDGSGVPIEIATMTPEQKRQRVAEIMAKANGTSN